jgi:flagellar assembly protein FliH
MNTFTHSLKFPETLQRVQLRTEAVPTSSHSASAPSESESAAYERGRRDGERELSEKLLQQRADLQALEQGVLKSLAQAVPKLVQECEEAVANLTLEIAEKLVAGLPVSPEMVQAVVHEALKDIEESSDYQIYLNPEDMEMLQRVESPLLKQKAPALQFQCSTEVSRGGCIVKTRFGTIDARRETKMGALQKSLAA